MLSQVVNTINTEKNRNNRHLYGSEIVSQNGNVNKVHQITAKLNCYTIPVLIRKIELEH